MDDRNHYFGNENHGVIVEFLRGQRADWDGRWLREIRTWDYDRLEEDHQYIQWLFPLTTESEAVFAPMLRQFEVPSLREDPQLRQTLVASFCQMLAFYGYDLRWEGDKCMVVRVDDFPLLLVGQDRGARRSSMAIDTIDPGNSFFHMATDENHFPLAYKHFALRSNAQEE